MPTQPQRQRILYLLVGLIVGAIATSVVWATTGGTAEVRIAARLLDDGRFEVGLQHRDAEAVDWSDIQRPDQRYLAPDAERNQWRLSSPLTVEIAAPDTAVQDLEPLVAPDAPEDGDQADTIEAPLIDAITQADEAEDSDTESSGPVVTIGPFDIVGTPTGNRPFDEETLFCVITHGTTNDFFWYQVYSAFADGRDWNDINLRAEIHEFGTDQADAIDQCVEDGAAAIATTLADVDALEPALARAQEAGVRLLTFNSGADRATAVGSEAHVALDEEAVGQVAAEQFREREVSGDLLCVIHEPTNRSLEERCDSLEASYDAGEVIRLRIAESDEDAVSAIAAAVTDDVGGALALNANTAYDMAAAIHEDHPDIVLGAVSADFPRPIAMLHTGSLDFVLWSHALEQGYHAITALLFAHGTPFPREIGMFSEATQITIQPSVITRESVDRLRDQDNTFGATLPAWLNALELAIETELAGPEAAQELIPIVESEETEDSE